MSNQENTIIGWLKRIFSSQIAAIIVAIIGVLVAIIGVIITYKTFKENKTEELSVELYNPETEEAINIIDATSIFVLYLREEKEHIDFIADDDIHPLYIPHLSNKSSKSLKNFHCEICVTTTSQLESDYKSNDDDEEEYEIEKDINSKFSFVIDEDDKYDFRLVYKENILRAHEALPIPIKEIWIPEQGAMLYEIDYKITYDGLNNPLILNVFIEAFKGKINDAFLKVYLTQLEDKIKYDNDYIYSKTISMIYSDDDTFAIIKDDKFLETDEFNNCPFYKFVSNEKGF